MADKKRTNEDQIFDQLNKAYKRNNTKSFVTQNDYYKYAKMMGSFYAKNFNGQKFVNISGKHLRAYVEEMKQKGLAPTTMRARLSGIRFYYEIMGGKNRLPDNESLGLDKRRLGKEDRAWLKEEIAGGLVLSEKHGRMDVYYSIKLGATFGLRRIECCRIRLDCIERALRYDELTVKGKGGQRRSIPVVTKEQKELLIELYNFAKKNKLQPMEYIISPNGKGGVKHQKESLENWMTAHREKFTVQNRTEQTRPNEKPKKYVLTWHGLRYYYAQNEIKRLKDGGFYKPKHKTSEALGHHRPDITNTYLAEKPVRKRKQ